MKIIKGFEEERFKRMARKCENTQLKKDVSYMRVILHDKKQVYAEALDDKAFFIGYHNKDHFRLVCVGVDVAYRGRRYGVFMLRRALYYAKSRGFTLIKTRTQNGVDFYQKYAGAKIVDYINGDYYMEIVI